MDLGVISVRYARALLKCALQQKIENNVYEDMQNLYNSYLQVPELRQTVDRRNKSGIFLKSLAAAKSPTW